MRTHTCIAELLYREAPSIVLALFYSQASALAPKARSWLLRTSSYPHHEKRSFRGPSNISLIRRTCRVSRKLASVKKDLHTCKLMRKRQVLHVTRRAGSNSHQSWQQLVQRGLLALHLLWKIGST